MKRSSTVISRPLGELDSVLGAVSAARRASSSWSGGTTPSPRTLPVTLVVITEQAGREVVAAAVPLAALMVDLYLHWAFSLVSPARAISVKLADFVRLVFSALLEDIHEATVSTPSAGESVDRMLPSGEFLG